MTFMQRALYRAPMLVLLAILAPLNAQFVQQGPKLVGTGAVGSSSQGQSLALSADGNTAVVGGYFDGGSTGAAWVYARNNGVWSQQGQKLVGAGAIGSANQGRSVALSADGNTAVVGGWSDNNSSGAVWIFTRSNGVWTQQGQKLVGTGSVGTPLQGCSVGLSADGNTAIVGGLGDNNNVGAVWIFTRSNGVWTQQGQKLVGTGASGPAAQGGSVALSADGNTAISGGQWDNNNMGAAWIFTRSNGVWSQQSPKLVGTGGIGQTFQGESVALSADGTTAIIGADDNVGIGAVWVFTRSSSVWSQQGQKLVGTGPVGQSSQGIAVGLSADGNVAVAGGVFDNHTVGAVWVYTRNNGVWSQLGQKLVGTGAAGAAGQGLSVALSGDGTTLLAGGPHDNLVGAAWVFVQPAPILTKTHSGNFTQGQSGATYSISMSNSINGAPTSGQVTVTDVAPSTDLFNLNLTGNGWACIQNSCSRSDVLQPGGNYPPISVTASVATTATSFVNTATVTYGPSTLTAMDPTTVIPASPSATLTTINPDQAAAGSSFPLSVYGVNFTSNNQIQWNGVSLTTKLVNSLELSADIGPNLTTTLGTANITVTGAAGLLTFKVRSAASCTYDFPQSASVGGDASSGSLIINATCPYATIINNPDWIAITSGASGSGTGTVSYKVSANAGVIRAGSITVLDSSGFSVGTFLISQAGAKCSFLFVYPATANFSTTGGSGIATLSIPGCQWTAVSSDPFVVLPVTTGNTPTFTFTVSVNTTGKPRSATVIVNSSLTIVITQSGQACTYAITTAIANQYVREIPDLSRRLPADQGVGALKVYAPDGCAWTVSTSDSAFIGVSNPGSGSGNSTVTYSVSKNYASSSRTGTITISGLASSISYEIIQAASSEISYFGTVTRVAPATVRRGGTSELVGDIIITPSVTNPQGGMIGDIIAYFSAPVTNQLLVVDTKGNTATDVLLLVGDPSPQNLVLNVNAFRGIVYGPNAIRFPNVQLGSNAGGAPGAKLRITNVRLDVSSHIPPIQINVDQCPANVLSGDSVGGYVTVVAPVLFPLGCAEQMVAQVTDGMIFKAGSATTGPATGQTTEPVTFTEAFPGAFRPKLASGQDPSLPGSTYNSESGFINSAVLGAVGLATNGTRLTAFIDNVPAGVSVFAPVSPSSGSAGTNAQLVSTGAGSLLIGNVTYQPVVLDSTGSGTATWEVTASSANATDSLTFNLLQVGNAANPGGGKLALSGSLAPTVGISAPSLTAPTPRFQPRLPVPVVNLDLSPVQDLLQAPSGSAQLIHSGYTAKSLSGTAVREEGVVGGTLSLSEVITNRSANAAGGVVVGGTLPSTATITGCLAGAADCMSDVINGNSLRRVYVTFGSGQQEVITLTVSGVSGAGSYSSTINSDSPNSNLLYASFSVAYPGFASTPNPADGAIAFTSPTKLAWQPADGAVNYRVFFGKTSPPTQLLGLTLSANIDLAAQDPGTYYWQVQALTGGIGTYSPIFKFTIAPVVPCSSTLSPASTTAGAQGGSGSVNISVTPTGCAWTVSSPSAGLTISPSSGNGSITATYSVTQNTSSQVRHLTATIQGSTFSVDQQGAPTITSLSPAQTIAGSGAFTLSVFSANLAASNVIQWNGTALTTTVVSSTQLSAPVGANLITTAGTATITATGASGSLLFTIQQPSACSYTISPSSSTVGSPGGSGSITVTTNPATNCPWTVSNPSAGLTITPTSGNGSGTATYSVTQNTSAQTRHLTATVATQAFSIDQQGQPTITSLNPSQATAGSPGFTLTVIGSNLTASNVIQWNGTALTTTAVSSTQLSAPVSANLIGTAGTATITGTGASGSLPFTIQPPTACSYSINPSSSIVGAPGGSGPITVTTNPTTNCPWTVSNPSAGLTIIPAAGQGSGTATYMVTQNNSTEARHLTVTIQGMVFAVDQQGAFTIPVSGKAAKVAAYNAGYWVQDLNGNFAWDGSSVDRLTYWSLGRTGEIPVYGDWNGDGKTKIGLYVDGTWLLDYNGNGVWDGPNVDKLVYFGGPGFAPYVGDWNGSGTSKIGVHQNGTWLLDYNGNFAWDGPGTDKLIYFGGPGYTPVLGDWNGSGTTKIGVHQDGTWLLDYNGNFSWDGPGTDKLIFFGGPGYAPVVGDWNGSGTTKVGAHKDGLWLLDYNGNFSWDGPGTDKLIFFGGVGYTPVVGDWNGSGTTKVGAYLNGQWVLDINGNFIWDPPVDQVIFFGGLGQIPIVGKW